jgi:hypothetical protein
MSSSSVLFFHESEHHLFDDAEQRVRIYMPDNVLHEVLYNPETQRVILMRYDSSTEAYTEFKDPHIRLVDVLHHLGIEDAHVGIMWVDPTFSVETVDADAYIERSVRSLPLSEIVVIPYTAPYTPMIDAADATA